MFHFDLNMSKIRLLKCILSFQYDEFPHSVFLCVSELFSVYNKIQVLIIQTFEEVMMLIVWLENFILS